MAGAGIVSVVPQNAEPTIVGTSSAPAAIDLVHRYALTFHPPGRGPCGASYTRPASASPPPPRGGGGAGAPSRGPPAPPPPCPLGCSAATMLTRSASACGRWPQRYVGAARCSVGDSAEESAPT